MFRTLVSMIAASVLMNCGTRGEDVDPNRFAEAIAKIETKISNGESKPGSVLFLGSSSIRLWDLQKSFPQKHYCNHGFGGSHISDAVHFFDRIVTPVKPSAIVFYAGDNDLANKKTSERVVADFTQFMKLVDEKCPDCRAVLFIGVKPSIKRWELREAQRSTNAAIAGLTHFKTKIHHVDAWNAMLGPDGRPEKVLFVEDGLHMTDAGYAIWTKLVEAKLQTVLAD